MDSGSASMWDVIEGDPEITHVKVEPLRIASGIRILPYKSGVAILGGPTAELFTGFGARALFSRLLPMLDGSRTIGDLQRDADTLDPAHVREGVANLYMAGLIRYGPAAAEADDTEAYLDRLIGYTGSFGSGRDSATHLSSQTIAISAPPTLAARMARTIAAAHGPTTIIVSDPQELHDGIDLLLAISTKETPDPALLFARANVIGVSALNVEISGRDARIGPFIMPRRNATYTCYTTLYRKLTAEAVDVDPASERFWSAHAQHLAMSMMAGMVKQPLYGAFEDFLWRDGRQVQRRLTVARIHGWDADGNVFRLPLTRGESGFEGWKQYCSVALQSAKYNAPNAYLMHYKTENVRAIYDRVPALYSGDTTPLRDVDDVEGLTTATVQGDGRINAHTLSALAIYAAGFAVRDGLPRRLVPTGGNLGSTMLSFLVRDVDGMSPGVYWFDSQKNVFERFVGLDVDAVAVALSLDAAPLHMISFANVPKVARKYGAFSFNIGWYDAGVLFAYLTNMSRVLGVDVHDRPRPDADMMLATLGLPSESLVPTGIFDIRAASQRPYGESPLHLTKLIRQRRGIRVWQAEELNREQVDRFLALADQALKRYTSVSGMDLALSLIVVLKRSDGEDGIYEYRAGQALKLLAPLSRTRHRELLSQLRLTESPLIVLPNVKLDDAMAIAGDIAVENGYKAAGAVVGDLWLRSGELGWGGSACGGTYDGQIRHLTGRHDLTHFAPLSLCIGPIVVTDEPSMPTAAALDA